MTRTLPGYVVCSTEGQNATYNFSCLLPYAADRTDRLRRETERVLVYWLYVFYLVLGYDPCLQSTEADRLWIQRAKAKPPRRKSAKRKATDKKQVKKSKVEKKVASPSKASTSRSKRVVVEDVDEEDNFDDKPTTTSRRTRTRGAQRPQTAESQSSPQGSSRSRAAKTRANVKLDIQARQFEQVKAEMLSFSRGRVPRGMQESLVSSPRTFGTRVSKRLRRDMEDEEWQQIPPEWLGEGGEHGEEREPEDVEDEERKGKRRRVDRAAPVLGSRSSARMASMRVKKTLKETNDDDVDGDGEEDGDGEADEQDVEAADELEPKSERIALPKTGLESDDESELTQLSDEEDSDDDEKKSTHGGVEHVELAESKAKTKSRARANQSISRGGKANRKVKLVVKEESEEEKEEEPEPEPEPEGELEPEIKEDKNFVEWETVRCSPYAF